MGQAISLPFKVLKTTADFYGGFFYYLCGRGRHGPYDEHFPYLRPRTKDSPTELWFKRKARIHLYSLASVFYLFDRPHYRKRSYREDLIDNLRNVAIPGTGLPLSLVVRTKLSALLFVLAAYPLTSIAASLHLWVRSNFKSSLSQEYATRLLAPDDWFHHWRLNCNLAAMHALLHRVPPGYAMENKWTFLREGEKRDVPISPFLHAPTSIVVKHKNEEGGLGIYFYKNATIGGDWIIQERLNNSDWVQGLLPQNAPLSTFRVITQSRASIHWNDPSDQKNDSITALSCVFRAGRQNAATDHDSILFDVDITTGEIGGGTTNAHWYRLGLWNALRCKWRSSHVEHVTHPDCEDIRVSGNVVPNIGDMLKLVEQSHWKLCRDVPLVGWDVVLSSNPNVPVCLLEVNLSCNFFRGSFDERIYFDFLHDSIGELQALRMVADRECTTFPPYTA